MKYLSTKYYEFLFTNKYNNDTEILFIHGFSMRQENIPNDEYFS